MLRKILKEEAAEHFPAAWPLLKPAVDRAGKVDRDTLLETLERGDCQLWTAPGLAAVTSISKTPLKTVCLIWLCGGSGLDDVRAHLPSIEEWARQSGCDIVEIQGRKGWIRVLPEYRQKSVILEKDLWTIASRAAPKP